ncbi:hypothetical protein [Cohnella terricola]|uniref:Uncharacterized protein n=1 Tax=Cohnella terricola TaxID=1289167 RepID=A0A559J4U1_9BACL|nr:hypothetical protein [Cohnella terricola]TVX94900.1 hypothetical protein FPZ45_24635 [Cohnella terricola]
MYFPRGIEKKAIAVNAARGGSEEMKSRTVFEKPTTKVFHIPGAAKMELGDDEVLFEKNTVSMRIKKNKKLKLFIDKDTSDICNKIIQ